MDIQIFKSVLCANDQLALMNRELLKEKGIYCINIMSTPGAGKTAFILELIRHMTPHFRIGVIEGDLSSSVDAEKVSRSGIPVVQLNTGSQCHLEAGMIAHGLRGLPLDDLDCVIIENVGNLVCTSEFDLGEDLRLFVASVPEGDDKPLKYPPMFSVVDVVVINKIDLLPYVDFGMDRFRQSVSGLNPRVIFFEVSATRGTGMAETAEWLGRQIGCR